MAINYSILIFFSQKEASSKKEDSVAKDQAPQDNIKEPFSTEVKSDDAYHTIHHDNGSKVLDYALAVNIKQRGKIESQMSGVDR